MMKVRVLVDIKAEPFQANGRATISIVRTNSFQPPEKFELCLSTRNSNDVNLLWVSELEQPAS